MLKEENRMLKERLEAVEVKIENMKGEIKQEIVEEVKERVIEELKEDEDKKSRQSNLILYNVKESQKKIGKEREHEDLNICKKIFEEGIHENEYNITKVIRLGKLKVKENNEDEDEVSEEIKPRPLLVKLETPYEKWNLIKKAKNLRNAEDGIRRVIVAPDLTAKERIKEKKLRDELMRKREEGDTDWYISKGKLLKRNFQLRE